MYTHCLVSINVQARVDESQGVQLVPRGEIQFYTFATYTLLCQMPFCQAAPLLPSATQQQNVVEYWWEGSTSTAVPPTSTSDVTGQHNKRRGTIFGALPYLGWVGENMFRNIWFPLKLLAENRLITYFYLVYILIPTIHSVLFIIFKSEFLK